MILFNLLEGEAQQNIYTYIVFGVIIVLLIVYMVFSSKKRKKEAEAEQQKRDSLRPGSKIMTAGGIIGKIVSIDEENFVLESEGTKLKFTKRAIYSIIDAVVDKKAEEKVEKVEKTEKKAKKEEVVETESVEEKDPFEGIENK